MDDNNEKDKKTLKDKDLGSFTLSNGGFHVYFLSENADSIFSHLEPH